MFSFFVVFSFVPRCSRDSNLCFVFVWIDSAMCDAFMKLTARGVTILYATGDGGVASSPGEDCDDEPFLAAWPTCP